MRVVIDTNLFLSALMVQASLPAHLIALWEERWFDVLTALDQLDELARVTRYPKVRERLTPAEAGRLINQLREVAVVIHPLPTVTVSPDPYDNYLLAIAQAGRADFLITGDKRDLLALQVHEGSRILTVRDFLTMHRRLP